MSENTNELSRNIEKLITSIQENIKNKNYNYISTQIVNLNTLILNYLLALDYEIKTQNQQINNFTQIKESININLQKIAEYLKTKDEKLINEVQNSLSQMYNFLFQPSNIEILRWSDIDEQKFFTVLNQISELSNKVYLYYTKKQIPKNELVDLANNILANIQRLP
ncbi:MAG: hypothetical protein N2169_02805 [bacterium]|nr:hypothetical protein [bacterium]